MLSIAKLTTKCQASIPKIIREKLHIKAGDYLEFDERDGEIILKKASEVFDKSTLKLMEMSLQEWSSPEDDEQFAYLSKLVK